MPRRPTASLFFSSQHNHHKVNFATGTDYQAPRTSKFLLYYFDTMGVDWCTCGLGNCCGATFSVHWTFWFNFAFQVVFAIIQYATSWKYILLIATVWGPACLLALALHEWGHIGATRCQRGTYSYSMLWPLGGFNDCTVPNGKCLQEFCIAICGPAMHIPLMMLWVIVLAICADEGVSYYGSAGFDVDTLDTEGAGEWFSQLAKRSLDVNIMIFCLNLLLPAYPLDAANMVAAVCGHFGLSVESTGWVLLIIGTLLGAALLIVGILYIIAGDGPGVFLLLLGLYVLYTSWQLYGQVKAGTVRQHPIFKPDCYQTENPAPRTTNLSQSNNSNAPRRAPPPDARQTPPADPRKGTSSTSRQPPQSPNKTAGPNKSSKKNSKKPNNNKNSSTGDIEMGNGGLPKRGASEKKSAGGPKKSTGGKKNAPRPVA